MLLASDIYKTIDFPQHRFSDAVPALFAIIFKMMLTDDSLSPISKISRNSTPIFVMWHNADADSALNFPKWIIQNNFIFNKLTDDSPSLLIPGKVHPSHGDMLHCKSLPLAWLLDRWQP